MKASINVEFTDEELEKYAVRVARRASLNLIHDVIAHLGALKIPPIPPGFGDMIAQTLVSAFASKEKPSPGSVEIDAEFEPEDEPTMCRRIEPDPRAGAAGLDEGWVCCRCRAYNGVPRAACRLCEHGRCDVVVPPPPAPPESSPVDPSAH